MRMTNAIKAAIGKAATPWYLAGGVAAANCVNPYQFIGAADYATSKINLANPGTYNCVPIDGVTEPPWNIIDGLTFTDHGINTGLRIPPTEHQWSMIVRYSNATFDASGRVPAGSQGTNYGGCLIYCDNTNIYACNNSASAVGVVAPASGVLCIAGPKFYIDKIDQGVTITGAPNNEQLDIYIGRDNHSPTFAWTGKIQAIAWYNVTLTQAQVTAITDRMNLLP
jgi:hypothetical protein